MVEGMQNLFSSFFFGGFKGDIVLLFGLVKMHMI